MSHKPKQKALSYDVSKVPERFRSQAGADILAALKHASTPQERNAYIAGMLGAYEVVGTPEERDAYISGMLRAHEVVAQSEG